MAAARSAPATPRGSLPLGQYELLLDRLLGQPELQERLLRGQDHVRVAAQVRDGVGGIEPELVHDRRHDRLDAAGPARPTGIRRIVGTGDRRYERDRVLPGRLPARHELAIAEVALVRHAIEEDRPPRPAGTEGIAHHRDERRVARPRRHEQVRSVVIGLSRNLPFGPIIRIR